MSNILMCYPGGRYKALTMSYDDGRIADRRLVELFNRYKVKGSFHINSGLLGIKDRIGEEELESLYAGHEVSVHTVTHPTLARCPKEQIVVEIMEDRRRLEQIMGKPIRGMSYPNGSFNDKIKGILPSLGIEYARVVASTGKFGLPGDLLEWQPTCHHNHDLLKHAETFVNLNKPQNLYLMYVWGHSYEFDADNNWHVIEQFCNDIGNNEEIWYCTNIEFVDYVYAFESLKFSVDLKLVYNPTATNVWLRVGEQIISVSAGQQIQL